MPLTRHVVVHDVHLNEVHARSTSAMVANVLRGVLRRLVVVSELVESLTWGGFDTVLVEGVVSELLVHGHKVGGVLSGLHVVLLAINVAHDVVLVVVEVDDVVDGLIQVVVDVVLDVFLTAGASAFEHLDPTSDLDRVSSPDVDGLEEVLSGPALFSELKVICGTKVTLATVLGVDDQVLLLWRGRRRDAGRVFVSTDGGVLEAIPLGVVDAPLSWLVRPLHVLPEPLREIHIWISLDSGPPVFDSPIGVEPIWGDGVLAVDGEGELGHRKQQEKS